MLSTDHIAIEPGWAWEHLFSVLMCGKTVGAAESVKDVYESSPEARTDHKFAGIFKARNPGKKQGNEAGT